MFRNGADKQTMKLIDKLTKSNPNEVIVTVRGVLFNEADMAMRISKVLSVMQGKGYRLASQSAGTNITNLYFARDIPPCPVSTYA